MKRQLPTFLIALLILACAAPARTQNANTPPNPGLKQLYQFGLLVRGPSWTPEKNAHTDSIQAGHMRNIQRMAATGKLLGAGPFLDNGTKRGVFIFLVDSAGEARALAAPDPAIESGRLALELHTWLGPKGIGEKYRERAKARPTNPDSMITLTLGLLQRGTAWDSTTMELRTKLEKDHRAHIDKMAAGGKLIATGPIQGSSELRGIYVFAADTAAARKLAEADPAVRAGRYTVEIHPWMTAWGVIP